MWEHDKVRSESEPTGLYLRRGHWVVPIGDGIVTQLRVDFAFTLCIGTEISIRIESPFTVVRAGVRSAHNGEDVRSLGDLLTLHQQRVQELLIREDGLLTIEFADGALLQVPPDAHYEAFNVVGSFPQIEGQFSFYALPGGGLARF